MMTRVILLPELHDHVVGKKKLVNVDSQFGGKVHEAKLAFSDVRNLCFCGWPDIVVENDHVIALVGFLGDYQVRSHSMHDGHGVAKTGRGYRSEVFWCVRHRIY
jgi:hypothetical protein